jgi:probable phosphoglycerate mutase
MGIDNSFYFIRHGKSENNDNNLINGWYDSPLSTNGIEDINRIKKSFIGKGITKIYTSDLIRVVQTAEIIKNEIGDCEINQHPNLRERHWGVYENTNRNNIIDFFMNPSGGETWEAYYNRVKSELNVLNISSNTLIVGHAGTMRVLKTMLNFDNNHEVIENSVPVMFLNKNGKWYYEYI